MTPVEVIHASARHALHCMSTPGADDPDAGDDIDEELDETGDITNRSNGKSGTNTEAEPDPK